MRASLRFFFHGFLEAKDLSDLDWIDGRWFRGVGRKQVVFFKLKLKPVMWIFISLCLHSPSEVISLLFVVFGFYPWHFHRVTAHLERGNHSEEPYFSPLSPERSCNRERSIPPGSLRRVPSLWWYSQGEYWHLFSPSWIWKRCLVAPTLAESVQSALIASRIILFHFPFLKVTVHPFLPSNPVQINLTLLLRNSDQIKVFLCGDDNSAASKFHTEMTSSYI